MTLALFDLDNTLLGGDSDHAWGTFLVAKGLVDGGEYSAANDRFYADYQAGTLDIRTYLSFALAPLTRFNLAELAILHREFMAGYIEPLILPKALNLLAEHRAQGHRLVIITATNRFITGPIATRLGVQDLLATEAEVEDGRYTGNISGVPCFQGGKVERLQQWLAEQEENLEGSYFYSDSANDLPLLEVVAYPIAVDADLRLAQWAKQYGHRTISLR
ncbi:MAG TPA: HAD family hydrolase [Cellvibrionaceae bacterium]